MAGKNFSGMDTGRQETGVNTGAVWGSIERGKDEYQQQAEASQEEKAERAGELRTQGRKGCRAARLNIAVTPENLRYLHILASATGLSMTKVVDKILTQHRRDHASEYDRAMDLTDDLFSIGDGLDN